MFGKASPFARNAFNKVSTEISESTKIELNNIGKGIKSVVLGSDFRNVDEDLGRLAKEFKMEGLWGRS